MTTLLDSLPSQNRSLLNLLRLRDGVHVDGGQLNSLLDHGAVERDSYGWVIKPDLLEALNRRFPKPPRA